jgi:hypothetical protein
MRRKPMRLESDHAPRDFASDHVPRPARVPVATDAVALVDDRAVEIKVVNLSDAGLMAECDANLPIGSVVRLQMPGRGAVLAKVRWMLGCRFGAAFVAPDTAPRPSRDDSA